MNKISIVGLGPGQKDYILPAALKEIESSDIIIGGKRNLKSIDTAGKITFTITGKLEDVILFIKENHKNKKISVIVSGDPGFYSMVRYIKKHFTPDELNIIPGVSSIQYMFSKICLTWENAYLSSLHGRDDDFVEKVKKYKTVALLTDKKCTPKKIAETLIENDITDKSIITGENLSYENEKITYGTVEEISEKENFEMSVVVITDELEL